MKSWLIGVCCLVLIGFAGVVETEAQAETMQSSLDEFYEFGEVIQGRWVSEIIWINDWPGYGKRGDTDTGYAEYQISHNRRVVTGREYAGPGSDRSLLYYDASKQQIVQQVLSSGGNLFTHLIYKKDGEWNYKIMGSTGEGQEITGSAIRYISDQGQTHRWIGEMFIDGERLDPLRDTYRRIGD